MVRFVLIRAAIKTVSQAVLTCAIVSDTALFSLNLGNTVSEASIRKNWDCGCCWVGGAGLDLTSSFMFCIRRRLLFGTTPINVDHSSRNNFNRSNQLDLMDITLVTNNCRVIDHKMTKHV